MGISILATGLADDAGSACIDEWSEAAGEYLITRKERELRITVRGVDKDDVSPEGLLDLLVVDRVISNPHEWRLVPKTDKSSAAVVFVRAVVA
ncbi:MAG: hypothetical protein ACYC48_00330 [Minisyncoccota bacterium]|nr:MAG: hypothetical protein B7W98_01495 [Parcubacteria group bacterium 20-58-5]